MPHAFRYDVPMADEGEDRKSCHQRTSKLIKESRILFPNLRTGAISTMIWRALDTMPALRISGHLPLCLIHVHWPHGFRDEAGYPPDPRNKDDNGVKVGNGPEMGAKD